MYIDKHIKKIVINLITKNYTIDPLEIIKNKKNLTLTYQPLSGNVNGIYHYISEKRQLIIINSSLEGCNKLFTILHELGHFALGHKGTLLLNSPSTKGLKEEYEADLFATYFFMINNCINKENIDNIVIPKRAKELITKFLT